MNTYLNARSANNELCAKLDELSKVLDNDYL